jgi:hypothetical protein
VADARERSALNNVHVKIIGSFAAKCGAGAAEGGRGFAVEAAPIESQASGKIR